MTIKYKLIQRILMLMIIVVATACSNTNTAPIVKIKQPTQQSDVYETSNLSEGKLRFAILSNASVAETYQTHYHFIRYIEEQLDEKIDIIQKDTYGEMIDLFESGQVDVGFVCGYLSVLGSKKGVMEKLAMPVVNGEKQYSSYIVARTDSDINDISDFEGLRFAFSNPYSFAGYLVPKYLIKKTGADFDTFFKKTYFTYNHNHSVSSVVNGLVDGAAIYSTTYDKLLYEDDPVIKEIQVIAESSLVGNHPIVVAPQLDKKIKEDLKNILLSMHENDQGKAVLSRVNYDYFIEIDEQLYTSVQPVLEEMDDIK